MAAIRLLNDLDAEDTLADADELRTLAAWSGWGAVPQVFDLANAEYAGERDELRALLTDHEWNAAARTRTNAQYTDPAYVAAIWSSPQLGLTGGRVLEPGCGSGTFIGLAPDSAELTGVEVDPTTARIAVGASVPEGCSSWASMGKEKPWPRRPFTPESEPRMTAANRRLPEVVADLVVSCRHFPSPRDSTHHHIALKGIHKSI